jgi:hypothetical protein
MNFGVDTGLSSSCGDYVVWLCLYNAPERLSLFSIYMLSQVDVSLQRMELSPLVSYPPLQCLV